MRDTLDSALQNVTISMSGMPFCGDNAVQSRSFLRKPQPASSDLPFDRDVFRDGILHIAIF